MLAHRIAMLTLGAIASGAIVEDFNPRGRTLLYSVSESKVQRQRCTAGVSRELNRASCQREGRAVPLTVFTAELASRSAAAQRGKRAAIARLENEIANAESGLADYRARITPLERENPRRWDRLNDLSARYQQLEKKQRLAREELAKVKRELDAWSEISTRLLTDDELHPFASARGESVAGSELVALFETTFSASEGKSFGADTWWDRRDGRVWWTDHQARTWQEAATACPPGYAVLTAGANAPAARAALDRLRKAFEDGETGFKKEPRDFWGAAIGGSGSAYLFRAWEAGGILRETQSARHPVMYITQKPMP